MYHSTPSHIQCSMGALWENQSLQNFLLHSANGPGCLKHSCSMLRLRNSNQLELLHRQIDLNAMLFLTEKKVLAFYFHYTMETNNISCVGNIFEIGRTPKKSMIHI